MVVAPEYLAIVILGILTNLTLLILIVSKRRLRRSKHASIASSLVAGLLFATIYILPRFAILFSNGTVNLPRDFRCGILSRIGLALFLCLNLHLLYRVLEVYIQVVYPFRGQEWLKKRNIIVILAIIWSITAAIPISLQMYLEIKATLDDGFEELECRRVSAYLLTIISIVLAALSIIILMVSSIAYAKVLNITNNAIKETQKVLNHLSSNFNNDTADASREKKKMSNLKLRIKSTVQALVFYLFYLLSLMPFLIMIIYTQFAISLPGKPFTPDVTTAFRFLQYIAFSFPAVQPFLFFFFTADFRGQLKFNLKSTTSSSTFSNKKPTTSYLQSI